MPDEAANPSPPITGKDQLVEFMESGCKPRADWRIGTEHEKFPYRLDDLRPLDYDGEVGIRAVLEGFTRFGWEPVYEGDNIIALEKPGAGAISLEPAGQLELSGAAVETIHATCDEVTGHLQQCKAIGGDMGIGFLGLGFYPKWPTEDMPWMPKGRYKIMREYMPKVGSMGLEMMKTSCTVQVNLDFDTEANMIKMFQVSLALQPIATALFANSPFKNGKPNGFLSYRSHVWTDTDPDRTGDLPFVFEDGFGFERYVDYILGVPMYFVYRDGQYIDASGQSFRDFMNGELPALPGEKPTMKDWVDHMSTAFPEVRLKTFLEMRGADGGPWAHLCALPALWVGLLYDSQSLDAAWDLIKDWTEAERAALRAEVPRTALATPFRNRTVRDVALEVLCIAHSGLQRRARLDSVGLDEAHFLRPLFQIAEAGITPAEELLRAYERRWQGSVDPVFREYAY
ncbi:MAG: glutamate--cysteine ligase [Magnetovibrio sp.]|nr:glutamate--cysteine ligase [Magnetovibrio sp.]